MNGLMPATDAPMVTLESFSNPLLDPGYFHAVESIAEVMARSSLIPESLQYDKPGKDDKKLLPFEEVKANCFLITNQALKWKADPFAVAQCCSIVHGRLMYEGKLVHAILTANLGIRLFCEYGRWDKATASCDLSAVGEGDNLAVRVWEVISTDPETGDMRFSKRFVDGCVGDWKTTGNNSPWLKQSAHRRQLNYRGGREWCRIHEPGVMLGIVTDDEFDGPTIDLEAAPSVGASASVIGKISAAKAGQGQASGFDDTRVQQQAGSSAGDGKTEARSADGPLGAKGGSAPSGASEGGSHAVEKASPSVPDDEAPKPSSGTSAPVDQVDTQTKDLLDEGARDHNEIDQGTASGESQDKAPAGDDKSPNEVKAWLHGVTEMLWAATHFNSHADTLKAQKKAAQASYPSTGIPERERNKATSVFDRCMDVASGALEPDDAKEVLAGLTGIDIQRLHNLDVKKREAGR